MKVRAKAMCVHCGGRSGTCPHCGGAIPLDAASFCMRCGSHLETGQRLADLYGEAAGAGGTPSKTAVSSSGRGPLSPQARQEFLDRSMPFGEKVKLGERAVALAEADTAEANRLLRDALAAVDELLPPDARTPGRTLDEALATARRDAQGRSAMSPELAARYRALFDAADRWHRAEAAQQAARSRQAALLGPVQARSYDDGGYRHPAEGTGTRWDPLVKQRRAR